ncbi:MAG: hypothetical protein V4513_07985 [Pseudomonadota bacterium]
MRTFKLSGNDTDRQLKEAADLFQNVQLAALDYQQHQGRSNDLLHTALEWLYGFGEMLQTQASEPARSLIEEFVKEAGLSWNRPTRRNPYIALVKHAFKQSDSSHSQYATVLAYASKTEVKPSAFKAWLHEGGGIKKLYPLAADHAGSARRQRNSQERASRLKIAREVLSARDHSPPTALPAGVSAPEGFALVLAKVTGDGKAAIIDVIDATQDGLDPVLLRYAPSKAAAPVLAAEPLGNLYRAIDLVVGCTDDTTDGHVRHVMVINSSHRSQRVCRIEAISEAYTYAWAGMMLSGHLDGLPTGIPFILTCEDAAFFRGEFSNHTGWTMSAADQPRIEASGLRSPITLRSFERTTRYRISHPPTAHEKPFTATHSDQLTVQQFLRDRRADHDRLNGKSKEKQFFPSALKIQLRGGKLEIALPKVPNLVAPFGTSSPDRDLSHLELNMGDVERVLSALAPYETTVEGSFVDLEVEDAGLCFQTHFDDDLLTVILPTKSGTDYNQSCMDLALPLTG